MGTLRFILAAFVVFQHIGRIPNIGSHAVAFFFVMSGYLMTFVMHESYGYSRRGFLRFWMNRILRLYPAYLLVVALSASVFTFVPPTRLLSLNPALAIPDSPVQWIENITMIYPGLSPLHIVPRLSPATWALTTELLFYAVISAGASRSCRITLVWFIGSLIYTAAALLSPNNYTLVYFSITGGSLPFACGAMIFHYRDKLAAYLPDRTPFIVLVCGFALLVVMSSRMYWEAIAGKTVISALAIVMTIAIASIVTLMFAVRHWTPVNGKLDKLLGDLSFPIYVSHWLFAVILVHTLGLSGLGDGLRPLLLALATLILSSLFGFGLHRFLDPQVEALRTAIRRQSRIEAA
jgi:peptidoglycan/LPS O-acetylase OafA/YrhL